MTRTKIQGKENKNWILGNILMSSVLGAAATFTLLEMVIFNLFFKIIFIFFGITAFTSLILIFNNMESKNDKN